MRYLSLLLLAVGLLVGGCGGSSVANAATPTVAASPNPALSQTLFSYLPQALPAALAQQMHDESVPVQAAFPQGVNAFSTAQYGTRLVRGTVDLGDVYDARIPQNAAIFQQWAAQQGLVACDPPEDHVQLYSDAAIAFMREFQYDGVLYFPDEFHPVFTRPLDTWLFLREEPPAGGPTTNFTSRRLTNRTVRVAGGVPMAPSPFVGFFYFYFPTGDTPYESYRLVDGPTVSTLPGTYTPVVGDANALAARQASGQVPTPLSQRLSVPVGTWMGPSASVHAVENGPRIGDDPDIYTWSDVGEYYLVLAPEYWVVPEGGAPSAGGGTVPRQRR